MSCEQFRFDGRTETRAGTGVWPVWGELWTGVHTLNRPHLERGSCAVEIQHPEVMHGPLHSGPVFSDQEMRLRVIQAIISPDLQ